MIIMYHKATRKELFNMTTDELYKLNGYHTEEKEKIKAELILRGDY